MGASRISPQTVQIFRGVGAALGGVIGERSRMQMTIVVVYRDPVRMVSAL